jgi:hypothetical protein
MRIHESVSGYGLLDDSIEISSALRVFSIDLYVLSAQTTVSILGYVIA